MPKVDKNRECSSERDPHQAPQQRFPKLHCVGAAVEDPQVEDQHRNDEQVEDDPESQLDGHQ